MFTTSLIRCQTCRLRSLIRQQQLARQRQTSHFSTTTPRLKRWKKKSIDNGELDQQSQVQLIETLFTSGEISRTEWRQSVWVQAGLEEERVDDDGLQSRVRRLREWYAGVEVPEELLEAEEKVVYERLFGGLRSVDVQEEEELAEEEDDLGSGVLREGNDGGLKEVEFEEAEPVKSRRAKRRIGDEVLAQDIELAMRGPGAEAEDILDAETEELEDDGTDFARSHPLTVPNRFSTFPSTLSMPKVQLTEPIAAILANRSSKQIGDHAHRIFGGPGLPYSTSTPFRGKAMPQKPIALDAYQSQMAEIEADVYIAALIPAVYASVMSVLVETRKRLGTEWARDLVKKAERGELKILDAGGAGAGVLAVRELLRAEWEIAHEESDEGVDSPLALAELDGKAGGEIMRAPLGQATVLTGSDTLRKRAAALLENTTFVPRLPDYVHTEQAKLRGKFDIVIAPHTLWPIRENHLRKTHVQNLWSLLKADGGLLVMMEKGVPRGFEMVAGARDMLLESRIASPGSETRVPDIYEPNEGEGQTRMNDVEKEEAMIVAPCTTHAACPMFQPKGQVNGRRDICAFAQRYHRPSFLQNIFGAKGRNHEDVEFSYVSILRGRDLRSSSSNEAVTQDSNATDLAFRGYEASSTEAPHALTLPRLVLPPLKRKGHVLLDLCTPAGSLERWTVPRSFSRQAYRDARKASWGDLWALGAKTRIPRRPVVRDKREKEASVVGKGDEVLEGGRARMGKKVKGLRDKRDKRGDGNGRLKRKGGVSREAGDGLYADED